MNKIVPALLTLSVLSMMTVGILISTKYMAEAPSLDNRSSAAAAPDKVTKKCSSADKKDKKNKDCYVAPATPKPAANGCPTTTSRNCVNVNVGNVANHKWQTLGYAYDGTKCVANAKVISTGPLEAGWCN